MISLILWTLKMCLQKNFLNLAFQKLLFGFWVKCVGSALGTRLGFARGEAIVTVVRMWNVIKIKISLAPPSCVFLLSCAVPEPISFNVVVRDRLLSGTSLERIKDETERDTFVSYSNNCFSSIQIFIFQALHNSGDGHISNFMRQQRRGKEGKGRRDLLALFSPSPLPFLRLLRRLLSLDFLKLLRIANEYAAEGKIYKKLISKK